MVKQTPRRGHQHFYALTQLCDLRFHIHAAKNHGRTQIRVFSVLRHILRHLIRQLACGGQYQRAHGMARRRGGAAGMRQHALQQRQGESRGFACTRLRRAHNIAPGQHHRNGLGLDGRHLRVAHIGYGTQNRLS